MQDDAESVLPDDLEDELALFEDASLASTSPKRHAPMPRSTVKPLSLVPRSTSEAELPNDDGVDDDDDTSDWQLVEDARDIPLPPSPSLMHVDAAPVKKPLAASLGLYSKKASMLVNAARPCVATLAETVAGVAVLFAVVGSDLIMHTALPGGS